MPRARWCLSVATALPLALAPAAAVAAPGDARAAAEIAGAAAATPGDAAAITATVRTTGGSLNSRTGASSVDRVVRSLADGTRLSIHCQVYGQLVRGSVRSSAYWNRLTSGAYVADGFVEWSPARPAVQWCGPTSRTAPQVSTPGSRLAVRTGPRTSATRSGSVPHAMWLTVLCQAWGEKAGGSSLWYHIGRGRFVAAGFVRWSTGAPVLPFCRQAAPSIPAPSTTVFIGRMAKAAQVTRRRYGVPASVTLAQAILESGWGRSMLARRDHNFFGIKCFGTPGGIALGCRTYRTSECNSRGCYRTSAQFRAYQDPSASIVDHGYFLRSRPRYRAAFRFTANPDRFVREIHKAGYATSPTYSTNLIKVMRKYGLYRYDG